MIEHLETDAIRYEKDNRPLLPPRVQAQTDGKKPSKGSGRRGKSLSHTRNRIPCRHFLMESVRTNHVIIGTLPCVSSTSPGQDAHMAKHADSDTLRLMGSPANSRRKVVLGISRLSEGVCTSGLCVSRFSSEQIFSSERRKIGITSHRQILQRHVASRKNREGKGPSRGVVQKCEPQERNSCAPRFEE